LSKQVSGRKKETRTRKQSSPAGFRKIVIRGSNGRFNGNYDLDQLTIKFMAFVFICSVIALLFL